MASSATNDFEAGENDQIHQIDIKPELINDKIHETVGFHSDSESGINIKKQREPKRLIYCSNGVLAVYDTEDESDNEETNLQPEINPADLAMIPWLWNRTVATSYKILAAIDFCGEKLAYAFGITSPKYQYAIDEYNRVKSEEEEERKFEEREKAASLAHHAAKLSMVEDGGVDASDVIITNVNKETTPADDTTKF